MPLNWAASKQVGIMTEIAVMVPVLPGKIPGENRTYEERLRSAISILQNRVEEGYPTLLDRVSTIHFGRMIILRPEQFTAPQGDEEGEAGQNGSATTISGNPRDFDAYREVPDDTDDGKAQKAAGSNPSWLITLVSFDRDIRVYFREIAEFVSSDFDYIFHNCRDFPGTGDFERFWAWIRRYQINVDLFYPRYPNLSLVRIKQLEVFKRRFDRFVAQVRSPLGPKVASMDELFDSFLRENQQYFEGFPSPGGLFDKADREDKT
jgi:hypothetical protein